MAIRKLVNGKVAERRYVTVSGIKIWAHENVRSTRTTTWSLGEEWKKDEDFVAWIEEGAKNHSISRSALAHDHILFKEFMNETDGNWSEFVDNYGQETDCDDDDHDGDGYEDWDCETTSYRKWVEDVPLHIEPCEDDEPAAHAMPVLVPEPGAFYPALSSRPELYDPLVAPVYEELNPPVQGLQAFFETLNQNQVNLNHHARNLGLLLHQMVDTMLNIPDGRVTWTPLYMTYFRAEFERVMDEHISRRQGTVAQTMVGVDLGLEIESERADTYIRYIAQTVADEQRVAQAIRERQTSEEEIQRIARLVRERYIHHSTLLAAEAQATPFALQ